VLRTSLFAIVLFGSVLPERAAAQGSDDFREAVAFAREKVYPALVNIAVVSEEYSGGRAQRFPSAGSGVIISPAGHVLTNYHVAGDAARVTCTLPSGEAIDADIVAKDPYTDLCVLKLRLESREDPTVPIPFATLGDSNELDVGDHVLAVGNPLSLSSSMTLGIVSNNERVFTDFTGSEISEFEFEEGQSTGIFNQWIQTDALILPGNSGGPLVNMRGEVIGINARGGAGVGFAIPAETCKKVLSQALTFGEVRRGWLGFSVMPVTKAGRNKGAIISSVVPGGPFEKAGVQAGDVLLALDGNPVSVRFWEQVPLLYQQVSDMPDGRELEMTVERGGERKTIAVTVEPLSKFLGEQAEFRKMGLTVRDVTVPMATARQYPNADGVLVTGVRPGYPFEEPRPQIPEGAVILALDGRPAADLAAFKELLGEVQQQEKFWVTYREGDEVKVTVVETGENEPSSKSKELPKAWLGVGTQVLTEKLAEALGATGRKGFRVTQVFPWTEAEKAGLKVGDLLVAMDGEPLEASRPQDAEDLRRAIEEMSIGDELEFTVLRDGAETKVTVDLEETPTSALDVKSSEQKELEFTVREPTFMDRVKFKWGREEDGLLVTDAIRGGWAHIAGLRINDLLKSVNGEPVADVKAFEGLMKRLLNEKPKIIQMFVRRGPRTHFVFIEPDWSKIEVVGE
jgi:serine protease Do